MHIKPAAQRDAEAISHIHLKGWQIAYADILPTEYLANLSYEKYLIRIENILRDIKQGDTSKIMLVAQNDDGKIVGFIGGGSNRMMKAKFDAELYAIYIDPEYKQKNVGTQLVKALVDWLVQYNYQSMQVWFLEQNSARKFYKKLGAYLLAETKIVSFSGKKYLEISCGWDDLRLLQKQLDIATN